MSLRWGGRWAMAPVDRTPAFVPRGLEGQTAMELIPCHVLTVRLRKVSWPL